MWFDTRAKLAEIEGRAPATPATTATNRAEAPPRVADVADVATPRHEMTPDELARDIFEERAAIREFCGGQDRAEAEAAAWIEARRAAGITALDDWRREADDPHNPDNWK